MNKKKTGVLLACNSIQYEKTRKIHKTLVGNPVENTNFEGHERHWRIILKPLKRCFFLISPDDKVKLIIKYHHHNSLEQNLIYGQLSTN